MRRPGHFAGSRPLWREIETPHEIPVIGGTGTAGRPLVAELAVGERGVYRVEIYLAGLRDFLGERKPWIISNPIYVR